MKTYLAALAASGISLLAPSALAADYKLCAAIRNEIRLLEDVQWRQIDKYLAANTPPSEYWFKDCGYFEFGPNYDHKAFKIWAECAQEAKKREGLTTGDLIDKAKQTPALRETQRRLNVMSRDLANAGCAY